MPVRPLIPELAEKARVELGETPEVLASGIQELKDWIAKQPHLRARTDDQWLATFLRGCKYRLDQAKTKMDLYYTLRTTAPYLYTLRFNDRKVSEMLDSGSVMILPQVRTPSAPRITIIRLGTFSPKELTVFDVMAIYSFLHQMSFMDDDNLTVAGVINIIDLRNSTLQHYTQASFKQIKNFTYANQHALPVRIKEVHFIGTSYLFETIINFVKRFLSDKLKNRFYMHSSIDTLYDHVPRDLLPDVLGGSGSVMRDNIGIVYIAWVLYRMPDYTERQLQTHTCGAHHLLLYRTYTMYKFNLKPNPETRDKHWKRKFVEYNEFFEEDLRYGTDEALRVKETK